MKLIAQTVIALNANNFGVLQGPILFEECAAKGATCHQI